MTKHQLTCTIVLITILLALPNTVLAQSLSAGVSRASEIITNAKVQQNNIAIQSAEPTEPEAHPTFQIAGSYQVIISATGEMQVHGNTSPVNASEAIAITQQQYPRPAQAATPTSPARSEGAVSEDVHYRQDQQAADAAEPPSLQPGGTVEAVVIETQERPQSTTEPMPATRTEPSVSEGVQEPDVVQETIILPPPQEKSLLSRLVSVFTPAESSENEKKEIIAPTEKATEETQKKESFITKILSWFR